MKAPVQAEWLGVDPARGHKLREPVPSGEARQRRTRVLVVGGGVAGLTCARELARRGIDFALLELDDRIGGNAQSAQLAGLSCPLGAHYLPQPGSDQPELQDLLVELGAATRVMGRWQAKPEHVVHAPGERAFDGQRWQAGLLPPPVDASALAQYRRFAQAVQTAQQEGSGLPSHRMRWGDGHREREAQPFAAWLQAQGLSDPALLRHLDYCCRDDYGAGLARVSAWAGLHYFASRHGFQVEADAEPAPPPLTWPEGNGWLTARMAAPLQQGIHPGRVALQLDEDRHGLRLRCWTPEGLEDWQAEQAVLAVPLFIAQRICRQPPAALREAKLARAPWLVANLRLDAPPLQRLGAPPAWDNVVLGSPTLGYVNAQHQSLDPRPGAQVWTLYWALAEAQRPALLSDSAADWGERVLAELCPLHPDLMDRLQQLTLTRHAHAMAIPTPGAHTQPALQALRQARGRVRFAHADLAAYSVFEEAHAAGLDAAAKL